MPHKKPDSTQNATPMPKARAVERTSGERMAPANQSGKTDLLGKSVDELRAWMVSIGEPEYRGAQIYNALYAERKFNFAEMTNLPAALRERLSAEARIGLPGIAARYCSTDGSVRYLLAQRNEAAGLADGPGDVEACAPAADFSPAITPARVEAVFMPWDTRQTICISTQAGCAVDCQFCLTAQLGLIRNLTAGEIIGQALVALEDNRASLTPRTNVVLMGQGEPLLNYEPVMAAVRLMLDQRGMGLAARHVTLSTSGIVPGISRLATETVRPALAISLNASSDEQRNAIMPINRKYPLAMLFDACRRYPLRTREYLTFEYVLLGGYNDTPEDARRVAKLVGRLRAKVNLIPWNPGALPYRAPTTEAVEEFHRVLSDKGVPVFVRYSRGQDISAACGQLALTESVTPATANLPLSQIARESPRVRTQ
jgi:23S rRNA (adenine2503-C2)-methyltransferase